MLLCGMEQCPCVRKKCERFGNCEECVAHHKTHKKYKEPYCIRKAEKIASRKAKKAKKDSSS